MKRSIIIKFKDGSQKELVVSKAVKLNIKHQMFSLDRLADGTWKIMFTPPTIEEFSDVASLEVKREG